MSLMIPPRLQRWSNISLITRLRGVSVIVVNVSDNIAHHKMSVHVCECANIKHSILLLLCMINIQYYKTADHCYVEYIFVHANYVRDCCLCQITIIVITTQPLKRR